MLSLNDPKHRPKVLRALKSLSSRSIASALLVSATMLLAGCTSGFQPIHASTDLGGRGVSDKLKSISYATIPGRTGQKLRNELIFASNGGSVDRVEQLYTLEVAIQEQKATAIVQEDGDAIAQTYTLTATFRLLSRVDGQPILRGTSVGRASLQKYSTIYSNVRALRDAQDRAARTVARDLISRLEAFLATQA